MNTRTIRFTPPHVCLAILICLSCLLAGLPAFAQPEEIVQHARTAYVPLYEGVDLWPLPGVAATDPTVLSLLIGDTGDIRRISAPALTPLFDFPVPVDLYFGLSGDPEYPVLLVVEQLNGLVVWDAQPNQVIEDPELRDDVSAVALGPNQVVMLETRDGISMLVGFAELQPDLTVRFEYIINDQPGTEPTPQPTPEPTVPAPIPEPSTLVLLGVGMLGLVGIVIRQHTHSKGKQFMKHMNIVAFIMLLSLFAGTASAAKLTVLIVGTGDGEVEGEDISCSPLCDATYEKGTVVQLKAFPDENSTFEGWMVNGQPHEGVIAIDQEDILVAAKFERKEQLNDLTIIWYNGNNKEYVTMALDEIAVFLKEIPENWYALEGDYKVTVEEIAKLFHPQAQVEGMSEFVITLKSPEPIPKEQLLSILTTIQEHEYIRQVAPVFYLRPKDPQTQMIPTGEIIVIFPATYTQEQISGIEEEYGLVHLESFANDSHWLLYQAGEPLESIGVANRLYESGVVESSSPNWIHKVILDQLSEEASLIEDTSFEHHWHLQGAEQNGANVVEVWNTTLENGENIRGSGVVIAVVDDGVEIKHPDLKENVINELCYDFVKDASPRDDPSPTIEIDKIPEGFSKLSNGGHGTLCAGVAAGRGGNGEGIFGVAPLASMVGYRAMSHEIKKDEVLPATLEVRWEVKALTLNNDKIHIYSNSRNNPALMPLSNSVEKALRKGIDEGRNDLGSIFVFGAGNSRETGFDSNYAAYNSSRYTITVAAATKYGTYAPYSSPGANIIVNAPCDPIPTTDRMGREGYNPWGYDPYEHKPPQDEYKDLDYTKFSEAHQQPLRSFPGLLP